MRILPVALALLMALGALPRLAAQEAPAAVILLDDATGDDTLHADATSVGNPEGRYQAADLVSLAVEESATDFTFHLAVASLSNQGETVAESTQYGIRFEHHGTRYQVHVARTVITTSDTFGSLESYDPLRQRYLTVADLPVTADAATATLTVAVPRDLVLDSEGAAPFPGRSLTGFHVSSWAGANGGTGQVSLGPGGKVPLPAIQVTDDMPDQGNGTLDWAVRFGIQQTGNARLSSLVPTRASNGEATTFVFSVEAANLGGTQRFRLSSTGVPSGWTVELPAELIEVVGGHNETLPVLVTTPFAHQHGTLQSFVLVMQGLDHAEDVGRIELGVRYTQPPQPAGHHDTVYLHTAKAQGDQTFDTAFGTVFGQQVNEGYFNTLTPDDDPNDSRVPVEGQESGFFDPPGSITYQWDVPLSPGLQMGLDVDEGRVGDAKVSIDTLLPMPGAVLTGRIVHTAPNGASLDDCQRRCSFGEDDFRFGFGNHTTIATIGPSPAVDVQANSKDNLFEAPIQPTKQGDFLPFVRDATLTLQLNLTFTRVDPFFGPHDTPKVSGGELVLPLLEYHDPVDRAFSSLDGLMMQVQGDAQRLVNPGKTALFDLSLMNHASKDAEYDLALSGTNLPWARILGDAHVKVDGNSSRPLGIAVTVPQQAQQGDTADLVLTAVDAKDPSIRTLVRLVTSVDTKAEHPDDSARVPGLEQQLHAKKSPGLPLEATLAIVVLAALMIRRRR